LTPVPAGPRSSGARPRPGCAPRGRRGPRRPRCMTPMRHDGRHVERVQLGPYHLANAVASERPRGEVRQSVGRGSDDRDHGHPPFPTYSATGPAGGNDSNDYSRVWPLLREEQARSGDCAPLCASACCVGAPEERPQIAPCATRAREPHPPASPTHEAPALGSAFGSEIDDAVGGRDDLEVVSMTTTVSPRSTSRCSGTSFATSPCAVRCGSSRRTASAEAGRGQLAPA